MDTSEGNKIDGKRNKRLEKKSLPGKFMSIGPKVPKYLGNAKPPRSNV